jgi:hypothetical protein
MEVRFEIAISRDEFIVEIVSDNPSVTGKLSDFLVNLHNEALCFDEIRKGNHGHFNPNTSSSRSTSWTKTL